MQIQTDQRLLSETEWQQLQAEAASLLVRASGKVVATCLDNTPAFLAIDAAAQNLGLIHVPLPVFFTLEQMQHALQSAGVDILIVNVAVASNWKQAPRADFSLLDEDLACISLVNQPCDVPKGTSKITFTSGTTAQPKGVCLSTATMLSVAKSIAIATESMELTRHLNALPFAVLLENIAGVMAPAQIGATLITLPLAQLGWRGASGFDVAMFHAAVLKYEPNSMVLLPQMLRAWCAYLTQTQQTAPSCLRMVAVGGAPVGETLIHQAHQLGLPAFEGYGLSEGSSVQTLNLPHQICAGSVGKPLPHAKVRIAEDGEIEISGSLMLGYLGQEPLTNDWWPSGDLGRVDEDGYLHIEGRKKNVLITSFGRNVSPEWVETVLRSSPSIREAVVFGNGQPQLSAVIWPMITGISPDELANVVATAVDMANAQLPDYARIAKHVVADLPFTVQSGMSTANGRPQRQAIFKTYANPLGLQESTI
jgi:long-subunit acyl-CoA synthetase (AMP-forming)